VITGARASTSIAIELAAYRALADFLFKNINAIPSPTPTAMPAK
jgi:hypothetical protein